jgi:hypothetical protein
MRLPADNSLMLANDNASRVLDRNDLIVADLAEAQHLLPAWALQQDSPVRDALLTAWLAMANYLQARIGQSLGAVRTPRFAQERDLDESWGKPMHKARLAGESDGSYRKRLLTRTDAISPNAIEAAVLADTDPIVPVFQEPASDMVFAQTLANSLLDSPPWLAYVQPEHGRLLADYPDNPRKYVGTYAGPANVEWYAPALFWVILPQDCVVDEASGYAQPLLTDALGQIDPSRSIDYLGVDADGDPLTYAYPLDSDLYDRIIADVEPLRAAGVTWMLFADPYLATAV